MTEQEMPEPGQGPVIPPEQEEPTETVEEAPEETPTEVPSTDDRTPETPPESEEDALTRTFEEGANRRE